MSWILVAAWVIISWDPLNAAEPEGVKEHFLKEAPRLWQEYEKFVALLQGEVLFKQTIDGKIIQNRRFEYKQNADCKLCLSQSLLKPKSDGELRAYNNTYAFTLWRSAPEHPWALVAREDREGDSSTSLMKRIRSDFDFCFSPLLRLPGYNVSIPQLMQGASFRILDIKMVRRQGDELVQLDFNNAHPPGEGETPIQRGILFLDPSRSWCLRSCTLQAQWGGQTGQTKIENQLADLGARHPMPIKVVQKTDFSYQQGESGPRSSAYEIIYDLREPPQSPGDEEFTLSAFGIPEPVGIAKRPMRWYLWLALAGILCLSLAALFRWLARRAKRSTSTIVGP